MTTRAPRGFHFRRGTAYGGAWLDLYNSRDEIAAQAFEQSDGSWQIITHWIGGPSNRTAADENGARAVIRAMVLDELERIEGDHS